MSDNTQDTDTRPNRTPTEQRREHVEYVERSDIGVSLTVTLTRGTGTRDQDKIVAKAKGKTLGDARADMDELRAYIHDLATEARGIQPNEEDR